MNIQCKDIPETPILRFLLDFKEKNGQDSLGVNWFGNEFKNSITKVMPEGTPPKLALAKMRMLIKRGLASGCGCGCRGDFTLTEKGESFLNIGV